MSTEWQKSCVRALIEGPTAFRLFRAKQVGVKMMDQYINKIWPYKKVKKIRSKSNFRCEMGNLLAALKEIPIDYHGRQIIMFKNEVIFKSEDLLTEIIENELEDININLAKEEYNNLGSFLIELDGAKRKTDPIYGADSRINIFKILKTFIQENKGLVIKIKGIAIHGNITGYNEMLKVCLDTVRKAIILSKTNKLKTKKTKEYKSINVGIEIEYDGLNCQQFEKRLLQLGAVSFHSGWDGSFANGDEEGNRLRENRLRIEGLKRINPLYYLLEQMKSTGCAPSLNSGMHYHIDCRDRKEEIDSRELCNRVFEILNKLDEKNISNLAHIFNVKGVIDKRGDFWSEKIKNSIEFNTLEWRMGTSTLNYKSIVLEILASIHLTQCGKYKNKKPNEEYLRMLGELALER